MNLKNIKEKMIIKNYKEMCEVLGEDEKKGNSRISQIKEWETYMELEKQGHKFIIKNIYPFKIEKQDDRKDGNNSVYSKDIQKLILDLLSQEENNGEMFVSTNQLLRKLQMVNSNYSKGRQNIPKLSEILKVDEKIIYDVFDYTHNKLRGALESALNSLVNQSWIHWSKEITVCISIDKPIMNELGRAVIRNGQVITSIKNIYRQATTEEIQLILRTEQEVLEELDCVDKQRVMITKQWNSFRNKVNSIISRKGNINFYYNSYRIVSDKDTLVERLGRFEKTDTFNKLNSTVLNQVNSTIDTKHKNAISKLDSWIGENPNATEIDKCRASDDYSEQSKLLTDKIINKKVRKIGRLYESK